MTKCVSPISQRDLLRVVVLGDINIDSPGITSTSPSQSRQAPLFALNPSGELGGHAANQAVAAASFGAVTHLVGRVGCDREGAAALDYLRSRGVLLDGVTRSARFGTGTATVSRHADGSAQATCNPGANCEVGSRELAALSSLLQPKDLLLLQLGVPRWVVQEAIIIAETCPAISVLDPAPRWNLQKNDKLAQVANIVTPNIDELAILSGSRSTMPTLEDVWAVGKKLAQTSRGDILITLGEAGVYVYPKRQAPFRLSANPVAALDPLAAGDTFNGVMAAALVLGASFEKAIRTGMAAANLTVQRHGSSSSIPVRTEILHQLTNGSIEKES